MPVLVLIFHSFYPFFDRISTTFSEMRITPHAAIAEGGLVCLRRSCAMRHTGDGLGMPATNKRVEITGISIVRVANGKLTAAGPAVAQASDIAEEL
jgi:hypothetical protein